jgi:hypothetical protein
VSLDARRLPKNNDDKAAAGTTLGQPRVPAKLQKEQKRLRNPVEGTDPSGAAASGALLRRFISNTWQSKMTRTRHKEKP